jgi:hypothetical protein
MLGRCREASGWRQGGSYGLAAPLPGAAGDEPATPLTEPGDSFRAEVDLGVATEAIAGTGLSTSSPRK